MINIDEFSIKKHILSVVLVISITILAGIYLQSQKITTELSTEEFSEDLATYHNENNTFSVLYPVLRYTVQEERVEDGLNIYFMPRRTKDRDQATVIHVQDGTRSDYVEKALDEGNNRDVISQRNIRVGTNISAKQLVFAVRKANDFQSIPAGDVWRLIETVFSRNSRTYVVRQLYDKTIDQIHPILLTSFRFESIADLNDE